MRICHLAQDWKHGFFFFKEKRGKKINKFRHELIQNQFLARVIYFFILKVGFEGAEKIN